MQIPNSVMGSTLRQSWDDLAAIPKYFRPPKTKHSEHRLDAMYARELPGSSGGPDELPLELPPRIPEVRDVGRPSGTERVRYARATADSHQRAMRAQALAVGRRDLRGDPVRLVVRVVVTAAVLSLASIAIVMQTNPEPAWGAIGLVIGYWLR